jgi:hypothetical protein
MRHALLLAVCAVACSHARNNKTGDGGVACSPEGAVQCTGSTYQACTNGTWVSTDCAIECVASLGCVTCSPGSLFCQNGDVWMCNPTGNPGAVVQQCTGVSVCQNGSCQDACTNAAFDRSYIGCEYWAVDLHNAIEVCPPGINPCPPIGNSCAAYPYAGLVVETLPVCVKTNNPGAGQMAGQCDPPASPGGPAQCPAGYACNANAQACVFDAQHATFAIVVSNPQARDANVTVAAATGAPITTVVPAGQVVAIKPQPAIADQPLPGSGQFKVAYKVTSDLPIVAYQFNPLDNQNVFSNDASLLVPRTAFDFTYHAISWPTLDRRTPAPGKDPYYGYIAIVAWQDGTQIAVTPSAAVVGGNSLAPMAAGTTQMFTLNAFDVLNLEAAGSGDLTGTLITSPNQVPFGVFGGHEATSFGESTPPSPQFPNGPCCADHLEHMLFPDSTWGMTFAIARSKQRTNEPDYLRVIAQKPNTSVTFAPAAAVTVSGNCAALQPGQFCDVKIQGNTEVSSTQPIQIGHFLESSLWQNRMGASVGTGDPSMAIAVPIEQYRTDYAVLTPNTYTENYLSISAAPTGAVTVDGSAVTLAAFPAPGTHRGAIVPVTAGQHVIHCPDGCGVLVYGYSPAVSYMYAGGLDLKQIVIQ